MSQLLQWANAPSVGAYQASDVAKVLKPAGFKSPLWMLAEKVNIAAGESLTIPHYTNTDLPTTTELTEDVNLPFSKLNVSAKEIIAAEHGRGLKVSKKNIRRAPWDLKEAHNQQIQEMLTRVYNRVIRTALAQAPVKYCTTSASAGTFTTNGTPSGIATDNVNIYHLEAMSNYAQDDLRIPFRDSGAYAGVFRHAAMFHIMRDQDFQDYNQGYKGLDPIAQQAVGKIADIEIMTSNDPEVVSKTLGGSDNISEGFIMGKEAVVLAYLEELKIVYDFSETKATDMGRFGYVAFVGDFNAGLTTDSANAGSARVIHFSSTS